MRMLNIKIVISLRYMWYYIIFISIQLEFSVVFPLNPVSALHISGIYAFMPTKLIN